MVVDKKSAEDLTTHKEELPFDDITSADVDLYTAAFNGDLNTLSRLAVTSNEKGFETGINVAGITAAGSDNALRKEKEKNEREFDYFFFTHTLELARQLSQINAHMAELSTNMDEIATNYLSPEEMLRKMGETDEQYYQRQSQLMKARHELGEVVDGDYATYEATYNEWLHANEEKRELQKELDKPEHQEALREIGKHQQHLETRHQEITQRSNSLARLFDGLKELKAIPEGADTAKDIAFMQLLQAQPEIAAQLNALPNAAHMTTDESITALEQIAEQTKTSSAVELEDVLGDKDRLSVIDFTKAGSSYAQQTSIETDNTLVQESVSSRAGYFASLKI